jgi:hypothetical protein
MEAPLPHQGYLLLWHKIPLSDTECYVFLRTSPRNYRGENCGDPPRNKGVFPPMGHSLLPPQTTSSSGGSWGYFIFLIRIEPILGLLQLENGLYMVLWNSIQSRGLNNIFSLRNSLKKRAVGADLQQPPKFKFKIKNYHADGHFLSETPSETIGWSGIYNSRNFLNLKFKNLAPPFLDKFHF